MLYAAMRNDNTKEILKLGFSKTNSLMLIFSLPTVTI